MAFLLPPFLTTAMHGWKEEGEGISPPNILGSGCGVGIHNEKHEIGTCGVPQICFILPLSFLIFPPGRESIGGGLTLNLSPFPITPLLATFPAKRRRNFIEERKEEEEEAEYLHQDFLVTREERRVFLAAAQTERLYYYCSPYQKRGRRD